MHTVIANRQTVGLAALGRQQPDIAPDLAGREDFAAFLPAEGADKGASEDVAKPEVIAPLGLAAAFWPGVPLVAGSDGGWAAAAGQLQSDGVQVPLSETSPAPDPEFASVAAAGSGVVPSSGTVPLDGDTATLTATVQALTTGSLPGQSMEFDAAASSSANWLEARAQPSEAEVAAHKALADKALSDDAVGWASVSGAAPTAVAGASVGFQLWMDALPQFDGPQNANDRLPVPPTTAPLAGADPILAVPNTPSLPTPALPAALVAKLAETALLSLFAAQAEAASLDQAEGAVGLAPAGAPSAIVSAPSVPGPVAVPQLAAQLVHTLTLNSQGTTEIALSPDELGHVRVTLQPDPQNPDRLVVMLNFERPETLDLFRRHADQLAEALRDAGFAGANIGFGHSGTGGNSDSRSEGAHADLPPTQDPSPGLTAGLQPDQPTLRISASSALDLRL